MNVLEFSALLIISRFKSTLVLVITEYFGLNVIIVRPVILIRLFKNSVQMNNV